MKARFPFHAFTGFYFWCLLGCFFGVVFGVVFGVDFFALEHVQDVFGAQHGPLLGAKMAPKSLQDGLEDVFNGQNESLQIPSVLQHFCALERVPRRE